MQTLDLAIFAIFFAINLIVGIKARGKKQSFRDFAVGDKSFSTATIVATIVATGASGSVFFNALEQTYSKGLYFILAVLIGGPVGLLFRGYVLAPRMKKFLQHVSMPDAMSKIYGKKVQFIFGMCSVCLNIGYTAIQFKVISRILVALFDFQGNEVVYITLITTAIVTLYSAYGGLKAVTFTDIIQFITFGTFIPALALTIWYNVGADSNLVISALQQDPNFSLSTIFHWDAKLLGMLALMCYIMTPDLPPELFQRMAMAKDIRQIKHSFLYSTCVILIIRVFIIWTAILLLTDNSHLTTPKVVKYMIDKHTYVGLKGLLGVGIIALAMSSADSFLNSTSVLVANDILPNLRIIKAASVKSASRATLVLGFLATLFSLYIHNILEILLLAANFQVPIVTIPVLLTIFGFRTSKRVIYIGMAAGATITAILLLHYKNINAFFPGMFANLIFLLGSHYLLREPGGWVKEERTDIEKVFDDDHSLKVQFERGIKRLSSFQLLPYIKRNLPSKGYYYSLLGFYLIVSSYLSLSHVPHEIQAQHVWLYRFIQHAILYIVPSLMLFPLWPIRLREGRFLTFVFPFLLFFPFFFLGTNIVLLSGFAPVPTLVLMLHIIITVMLSSYRLVLSLAAIGVTAGAIFFQAVIGNAIPLSDAFSIQFQVGYALLLFITVLIALLRSKHANEVWRGQAKFFSEAYSSNLQELLKALKVEERFAKSLDLEGIQELEKTANASQHLVDHFAQLVQRVPLQEEYEKDILGVKERLVTTSQYLNQVVHRATTYLRLNLSTVSVKEMVSKTLMKVYFNDIAEEPHIIVRFASQIESKIIQVDLERLKDLFFNAISYTLREVSDTKRRVFISLDQTKLVYKLNSVEGHNKTVPALRIIITTLSNIPANAGQYMSNMDESIFDIAITEPLLHLFLAKKILQAHYGHMSIERGGHDEITQTYVIPIDVRDVRPKEMDLSEIDPETELMESNEVYPGAKKQEEEFLTCLKLSSLEEEELVHKALRFIKKYHGPVKRKSGEPFYLHPVMVAKIATSFTQDLDVIIAALLHDVVEDTAITLPQIQLMFNDHIAQIVDRVTHLDSVGNVVYRLQLQDHENLNQLLDAEEKGVLYVKLADRMHNMRTIKFHSSIAKQKKIAGETLSFFVPIAKYLGLYEVAEELKTMSVEVMEKQEIDKDISITTE